MPDLEKEVWMSLDRRLGEHDTKISNTQRDYTELRHEISQLMERINLGVSPTQNKILDKQSGIEKQLLELTHKIDMDLLRMNEKIENVVDGINSQVDSFKRNEMEPLSKDLTLIKKTVIWGPIAAVFVLVATLGVKTTWEKFFQKEQEKSEARILEKYRKK